MRLWPLIERDRLLARPFPSGAAAPIALQAGTEHLSRRAHSACAERRSESIDSPVASSTPVCTRWMGWTRLLCSISRMPLRYSHKLGSSSQGRHEHFRRLWLHGSAHNAVSSWSMAVTECMALLHCTEVHAMRLWPLIERDWLLARPFPSGAAAPIAPQAGTEHLSRTAHSACAERRSESIDSPVASSTPVCTRWMGWTRLLRSISRMPLRYS